MIKQYEDVSMANAQDWGRYLAPRTIGGTAAAATYSGFDWED